MQTIDFFSNRKTWRSGNCPWCYSEIDEMGNCVECHNNNQKNEKKMKKK